MAKAVRGFMSKDGQFFETKNEVDLYEAEKDLTEILELAGFKSDKYLELVETFYEETIRWFKAKRKAESLSRKREDNRVAGKSGAVEADPANDGRGTGEPEAIQQQSRRRRKSMPNVGRGKRTEKISD